MERKHCPAFNKRCNRCSTKGHFGVVCQKNAEASPALNDNIDENGEPVETLETINAGAECSFSFGAQDFRTVKSRTGMT